MRCPLCGSADVAVRPDLPDEFLVCGGCQELLWPAELVRRATRRTRRRYCLANFGQPAYPGG